MSASAAAHSSKQFHDLARLQMARGAIDLASRHDSHRAEARAGAVIHNVHLRATVDAAIGITRACCRTNFLKRTEPMGNKLGVIGDLHGFMDGYELGSVEAGQLGVPYDPNKANCLQ